MLKNSKVAARVKQKSQQVRNKLKTFAKLLADKEIQSEMAGFFVVTTYLNPLYYFAG